MPTKKLTLSVDENIIRSAKNYAKEHNTSVSAIFSNVISAISSKDRDFKIPVNSTLNSIAGILKDKNINDDDLRYDALSDKYDL